MPKKSTPGVWPWAIFTQSHWSWGRPCCILVYNLHAMISEAARHTASPSWINKAHSVAIVPKPQGLKFRQRIYRDNMFSCDKLLKSVGPNCSRLSISHHHQYVERLWYQLKEFASRFSPPSIFRISRVRHACLLPSSEKRYLRSLVLGPIRTKTESSKISIWQNRAIFLKWSRREIL